MPFHVAEVAYIDRMSDVSYFRPRVLYFLKYSTLHVGNLNFLIRAG